MMFLAFAICFSFGASQVQADNMTLDDMLKAFFAVFLGKPVHWHLVRK